VRLSAEPSLDATDYPFSHRIRVRFAETDAMGIVHHSRYLPYLEETRVAYLRHLGHPYSEMRAEGVDYAVLECFVQYRKPLRFDEQIDVHLQLASVTRTAFQMAYLVTVEGLAGQEVRAAAVTVHGCITAAGRPTRLPEWLADVVGS
jgi:acyl-CoA thioester hydrolase